MKILVIQTAFLGDVILATPVMTELKRLFPESSIDILVKKGNESLLKSHPSLHEVLVFDKTKGKYRTIYKLIKQFRKQKYDLVLNLHRFGSSGILAGLSGGKKIYGFGKNPFSFLYTKSFPHSIGDGTHEVERNLSLISEFGAVKIKRPDLQPSLQDYSFIGPYVKEEFYCIAPASVWFTKQLPIEKWLELIKKLDRKKVYLLGSPADYELCQTIIEKSGQSNLENLAGKLTLLQSAALMREATRNYVNDSGPLHLASAVNAKVTAYFCSTIPDFGFGPLSVDAEIKEVKNLDCRPCGLHGYTSCPQKHFRCGHDIEI